MRQATTTLCVETKGIGLYEFTHEVAGWVQSSGITEGLLTLFIRHTSASLAVQENADPDVRKDLADAFDRMAPMTRGLYRHSAEGPDDMPAHIKAALSDVSLSIPVLNRQPVFGTWQGVYVFEHRTSAQERHVVCHLAGA
ncbi:secondary thiamine-phosphate synthase enzyme YjbQ [Kordiimonas aestuarii]|uniref:secondary thiamine-phosphate synthase enzyme YjbQ n=1 Tax=Kordiimonas aestuarii TaxID=1005925 RepID=UPI0021D01097|nr:secondary thiamine-phosphate synthase enzyme YjbQ [Kordiimonas aestuarii]